MVVGAAVVGAETLGFEPMADAEYRRIQSTRSIGIPFPFSSHRAAEPFLRIAPVLCGSNTQQDLVLETWTRGSTPKGLGLGRASNRSNTAENGFALRHSALRPSGLQSRSPSCLGMGQLPGPARQGVPKRQALQAPQGDGTTGSARPGRPGPVPARGPRCVPGASAHDGPLRRVRPHSSRAVPRPAPPVSGRAGASPRAACAGARRRPGTTPGPAPHPATRKGRSGGTRTRPGPAGRPGRPAP